MGDQPPQPKHAWDEELAEEAADKSEDEDAGQPLEFDPSFKGPLARDQRQYQNCCAAVLLGVLAIVLLAVLCYSLIKGNSTSLVYGLDLEGNRCGIDNDNGKDYSSREYLYWPQPVAMPSQKYCVASCPSGSGSVVELYDGTSWASTYGSTTVLNRCLPDSCAPSWSSDQCSTAKSNVRDDYPNSFKRVFADCATIKGMLGMGLGLVASLLLNVLLGCTVKDFGTARAAAAYWITVVLLLLFATLVLTNTGNVGTSLSYDSFTFKPDDSFSYVTLCFGLLIALLWLGILVMGWYMNKERDKVEFVMRELKVAWIAIPQLWLAPLPATLIVIVLGSIWVCSVVFLTGLSRDWLAILLGVLQLYAVCVGVEVANAATATTVSGTVGVWYWSSPDEMKVVQTGECARSFRRSFWTSLGSMARGGFVLAWFRPLIALLQLLHREGECLIMLPCFGTAR